MGDYIIKDSGQREQFPGGMMRDTAKGKIQWWRVFVGPLLERYAVHLTKGADKYPDVQPGVPNWILAAGEEELARARDSLARHFVQYLRGDQDEDHAAAIVFNLNQIEYIRDQNHG